MANPGKPTPGNLSKDREKTLETGKKGGHASSPGSMGSDRSKAPEAGKKGGHPTPGGGRGQ